MNEHQVVVVFDVQAPDRQAAARAVLGVLRGTRGNYTIDGQLADAWVDSWWFPEADLKAIDRNDNAAMHLEHDDRGGWDCCPHCADFGPCEEPGEHERPCELCAVPQVETVIVDRALL